MIESKVSSFRVMGQQRAIMAQCGTVLRAAAGHFARAGFACAPIAQKILWITLWGSNAPECLPQAM
jgi:hypothetical protein